MLRIFSIFLLNVFVFCSLFIRFMSKQTFENYKLPNRYSSYKKIAAQESRDFLKAIILIPGRSLKIIRIFKQPIGTIIKHGQKFAIDREGNLFTPQNTEQMNDLVEIT